MRASHLSRLCLAAALLAGGAPAAAQLRPLEPLPWSVLEPGRTLELRLGVGVLHRQRAALAGTEGTLLEAGNLHAAWRSGRMAVEVQGTALRRFRDRRRFDAPDPGTTADGPRRSDAGDFSIATLVRLSPEGPATAVLRFGTRLPNSNDRVGLDRDRTDFFALLGGQLRRGPLRAAAEAGLGILGTHLERYEQSDVLLYSATLERDFRRLTPTASLTGHLTPHMQPRGNEDLAELRLGVRAGRRRWVHAAWVRGLTPYSPATGLLIVAGTSR